VVRTTIQLLDASGVRTDLETALRTTGAIREFTDRPVTRAEVARILALGLIRLHVRQSSQLSDSARESCLHFPPDQSGHAKPKRRRTA